MQRKFENLMRETGKFDFPMMWGNATPEQKAKLTAAQNIAAENVYGEQGHASSEYMYLTEKEGLGFRKAVIRTKAGGITHVTVSENPTEKELRGARAKVYQRDKNR